MFQNDKAGMSMDMEQYLYQADEAKYLRIRRIVGNLSQPVGECITIHNSFFM